jgi:hypothetical protein
MELYTHKPGVVLQFNNLHTFTLDILANESESGLFETVNHFGIDFVTVSVSFLDLRG